MTSFIDAALSAAYAAGVREEREACAEIAETVMLSWSPPAGGSRVVEEIIINAEQFVVREIASAIRARVASHD